MSRENVEAVRTCLEAYRRGDYAGGSAYLAPDVVWEVDQELPAHGPAAVRDMWTRWNGEWEQLETVTEEFVDGGDHVVVAVRYRGRGRVSGVEVNLRVFEVHTFRDGRCVRKVDFRERSEALEAAGLSGWPMSRENVEVVVKQFGDANARDFAAVMEAYAEDVMLVMHGEKFGVLGRTATGKTAVGEWFGDWFRQFGRDYRFDIEESRGIGDRVFIVANHHGRGRDSGVPVEERWAYVYTVREGKVSRVELWGDRDARGAALEAAGLCE